MEQLQAAIAAWAAQDPDVQGLAVVGSRARADRPADPWSDLDLLLVVDTPTRYLADARWVTGIGAGEPLLTFLEPTAVGDLTERRALFAGGRDVDFAVLPTDLLRDATAKLLAVFGDIARRGIKILVDKAGHLQATVTRPRVLPPPGPPDPPSEQQYRQVVDDLLYHLLWAAKKLRRGELWTAWTSHQWTLGRLLIRLLEWEASTRRGTRPDTWHSGRFLEKWGHQATLATIPAACGGYEPRALAAGLSATLGLTQTLGCELANRFGYHYPTAGHEEVAAFLAELEPRAGR